jgi:hypothetical protein
MVPQGGFIAPPAAGPGMVQADAAQQGPVPAGAPGGPPNAGVPSSVAAERVESILAILRNGANQVTRTPPGPGAGQPGVPLAGGGVSSPSGQVLRAAPGTAAAPVVQDLDGVLRGTLVSLKEGVVRREPTLAAARATVGNITEEGQPWSGPLGVLLHDQLTRLVESGQVFSPAPGSFVRGIAVRPLSTVQSPNSPQALNQVFGSDVAIVGSYRLDKDIVRILLRAVDATGRDLSQQVTAIPSGAIPGTWAASPGNATDTSQLLGSLNQLGPQSQGAARVELATNRPGAGASFRLGDEIRYVVGSTVDGYLYLFHIDADKNVLRIFPNQYQKDARVTAGSSVEVPVSGAPFKFEASPPFGLETTVAIVTAMPLDEGDFRAVEGGFAKPRQELTDVVTSRGVRTVPADSSSSSASTRSTGAVPARAQLAWNFVTVLIRP